MTLFGIDISNFQNGINLASVKAQGYSFVAAKCTQAANYVSADYARQRDQAINVGLPFCAYHFLRPASVASMQAQVNWLKSHIGNLAIPVMLDVERWSANSNTAATIPSEAETYDFIRRAKAAGLKMKWLYWQGEHALPSGMLKWHANYGSNPKGYASAIYPGDNSSKWNTSTPTTIWQFGSNGKIDGWNGPVDVNAYRGTLSQLLSTGGFYVKAAPVPVPVPKPEVSVTQAEQVAALFNNLTRIGVIGNDEEHAAGYFLAHALANTEEIAKDAETRMRTMFGKMDALTEKVNALTMKIDELSAKIEAE